MPTTPCCAQGAQETSHPHSCCGTVQKRSCCSCSNHALHCAHKPGTEARQCYTSILLGRTQAQLCFSLLLPMPSLNYPRHRCCPSLARNWHTPSTLHAHTRPALRLAHVSMRCWCDLDGVLCWCCCCR